MTGCHHRPAERQLHRLPKFQPHNFSSAYPLEPLRLCANSRRILPEVLQDHNATRATGLPPPPPPPPAPTPPRPPPPPPPPRVPQRRRSRPLTLSAGGGSGGGDYVSPHRTPLTLSALSLSLKGWASNTSSITFALAFDSLRPSAPAAPRPSPPLPCRVTGTGTERPS